MTSKEQYFKEQLDALITQTNNIETDGDLIDTLKKTVTVWMEMFEDNYQTVGHLRLLVITKRLLGNAD